MAADRGLLDKLASILERQSMLNADMAQAIGGLDQLDSKRGQEIAELREDVTALSNRLEAHRRYVDGQIAEMLRVIG